MIKLLLLTGTRKSEVASLRWEWIEDEVLTIPGAFTKNGRIHRLPLGRMALEEIQSIDRTSGYVLPGRVGCRHALPRWKLGKLKAGLDKASGVTGWVIHDLRRTFATGLAALGVPIHVTEKLLNHVSGTTGGIVGVYQRHSFFPEMRNAINVGR